MNYDNIKLLTVNISPVLSKIILQNFSGQKYLVTIAEGIDSLYMNDTIDTYQLVIVGTDNNRYSQEELIEISQSHPNPEFIIVDNNRQIHDTRFFDVITNDVSEEKLVFKIQKAIKTYKQKTELLLLKQQVAMNYGFDNLVGHSKALITLKDSLRNVSATDISVLLTGATGVGKTLAAYIMHHHSDRRKNPLITLDCTTIPETLADEIIFGRPENKTDFGVLQKAHTGTLILKNLEHLSTSTQHQFINFLLTRTIRKNDNISSEKLDVRIISTTEADIPKLIANNKFVEELYHQLGEVTIQVSTLTKRIDDIEALCEYFTRKISFETGRPAYTFSRGALELLFSHSWTGNIRELENTIKRATTLCRNNFIDEPDILFIESGQIRRNIESSSDERTDSSTGLLDEGQKTLIIKALKDNSWNFTQTAQELGIGRTTLWRKVKKYNLKKEELETV